MCNRLHIEIIDYTHANSLIYSLIIDYMINGNRLHHAQHTNLSYFTHRSDCIFQLYSINHSFISMLQIILMSDCRKVIIQHVKHTHISKHLFLRIFLSVLDLYQLGAGPCVSYSSAALSSPAKQINLCLLVPILCWVHVGQFPFLQFLASTHIIHQEHDTF